MTKRKIWHFQMSGWLLFIASALVFIFDSLRAGNMTGLIASSLFFSANLVFMVPVWHLRPRSEKE